jgi:hypothetical protein
VRVSQESLLRCNFRVAISNIKGNKDGSELNGAYHLLVYVADANLLRYKINSINKIKDALLDAAKEVGLEVNTDKTKYLVTRLKDKSII